MSGQTARLAQIDRRHGLTPETFFEQYARPGKPVVLEGLATYWKERWTPQSLKAKHGGERIVCETEEVYVQERKKVDLPLSALIDKVTAASTELRVRSFSFLSQVPELQEEFRRNNDFERYFERPDGLQHAFWIAPPNNTTLLHQDTFFDNLNVQIYGRKHFILVPPSDYRLMYAHFLAESPVNPLEPDLQRFPRFARARLFGTVLEPGDVIFIPQFWWHYVKALELSININSWMRSTPQQVRQATSSMPWIPRLVYRTLHRDSFRGFISRNERWMYKVYSSLKPRRRAVSH